MPSLRRLIVAYSTRNRRAKARHIQAFMQKHSLSTAVFVGVGGGREPNEAVLEAAVAESATVLGSCDVFPAATAWPFVVGSGTALPFRTGAVDVVISNAVVEHVGTEDAQRRFVQEHDRVGRGYVITTPNKWFPVESHTNVVILHWFPAWRRRHQAQFTRLLSRQEFQRLLPRPAEMRGRWWSTTFMALVPPRSAHSDTREH